MEIIEERGYIITISEYGKIVRQYHDTNIDRFMRVATEMVSEHMSRSYKEDALQNTNIHYYLN